MGRSPRGEPDCGSRRGWTTTSANIIRLALGTAFRYWSYRHIVFEPSASSPAIAETDETHPDGVTSGSDPRRVSTPQEAMTPAVRINESAAEPVQGM
jgi:hypothetical protein